MPVALTTSQENARHGGQRNHLAYARTKAAPLVLRRHLSLAGKAALALFPWSLASYLGQRKSIAQLLRNAPQNTVRDWMRGRRKAPQWACEILVEALETRASEMLDLAKRIKEKGAG